MINDDEKSSKDAPMSLKKQANYQEYAHFNKIISNTLDKLKKEFDNTTDFSELSENNLNSLAQTLLTYTDWIDHLSEDKSDDGIEAADLQSLTDKVNEIDKYLDKLQDIYEVKAKKRPTFWHTLPIVKTDLGIQVQLSYEEFMRLKRQMQSNNNNSAVTAIVDNSGDKTEDELDTFKPSNK